MLLLLFACVDKAPSTDSAPLGDSDCEPLVWYADADGDGFGDVNASTEACDAPSGHVQDATDCDDSDAEVSPDGTEVCNGLDDDCDGETDPRGLPDGTGVYRDADGDGYGDPDAPTTVCQDTDGYVSDSSDCDDSDAAASPEGDEVCDGLDNDCDGSVDWDQRVPTDHADIATAIDATEDGGVICVEAGTYTEPFGLTGRALSIVSSSGAGSTVFDVGESAPFVEVSGGSDVVLDGFTVTNVPPASQGGFAVVLGSAASLSDIAFETNSMELFDANDLSGALVWASESTLAIEELVVSDLQLDVASNADLKVDGAVVYATSSDVTLSDVSIDDVTVASLGVAQEVDVTGLIVDLYDTTYAVEGLVARDMVATLESFDGLDFDGLILATSDGSVGSIEGVEVIGTQVSMASQGSVYVWGALSLDDDAVVSDVEMHDNVASASSANTSTYAYSAAVHSSARLELSHGSFTGNEVHAVPTGGTSGYAYGAAIHASGGGDLDHVDLRGNLTLASKYAQGGALSMSDDDLLGSSVTNSVFAGNVAGDATTENALGGGLYLLAWDQPAQVVNADVFRNEANGQRAQGAGVYFLNGDGDVASSTLTNVSISSNVQTASSEAGGTALHFEDYGNGGTPPVLAWCNVYDQDADAFAGISDPTGADGNVAVDPGYVDVTGTDPTAWDLTLDAASALIDAGDPTITDADGSTSDIGAYGGAADW